MRIAAAWLLVSLGAIAACTISTGDTQPTVLLVREDGSQIQMPPNTETFAYCAEGAIEIFRGNRFDGASWSVSANRIDVSRGQLITFPTRSGALVFVNDDEDDNEAASDQLGSTGTISFQSIDCGGFIEFTVRASIGSEVGGPPITVKGSFRAPAGARPD